MRLLRLLFIVLMLSASWSYAQSDLIGRWDFEEGSGTTTADLSGNSHDGTIMGTTAFSTDAALGSYSVGFNRVNGNYVDVGSLDLGDQFTVCGWIKIVPDATNIQCFFSNVSSGDHKDGFSIMVNQYPTTDKSVFISTGNNDGTANDEMTAASNLDVITYDAWNHIAVSFDKTDGTLAVYVNGVDETADGTILTDFNTSGQCNIGSFIGGSWAPKGFIDDVRIYTKVLSAAQVMNVKNGMDPGYTLSQTVVGEGWIVPEAGAFTADTAIALTAVPKYGWEFAGWSGDASGTAMVDSLTMDADKSVTATFVPVTTEKRDTIAKLNFTYEPVLDDEPGWTGIYDQNSFPLTLDNGVEIELDSEEHSVGSSWRGYEVTPFPYNVGHTYIYMHDAFPYTLTFSVSGLDTAGSYAVELFSGRPHDTWQGENSIFAAQGDTLIIDAINNRSTILKIDNIVPDSSGVAVFSISNDPAGGHSAYINAVVITKKIEASLNIDLVGSGKVVSGSESYVLGQEVELTAIPDYGWKFEGWSGAASGSDLTTTVAMDSVTNVVATFVPATTEKRDTVAKLNFTYEPVLDDVDGWTGIYDHTTPPIDLPNGIHIELETQSHSTGSGKSGEPITPFPNNVGNTFNYLHALSEPYSLRLIISGLDTLGEYSFDAFSSRNGATSSGYRPANYTVEGTGDTVTVNCVGNKSTIATISNVSPDSTGTLVFSVSNAPNSYAYINALVITKKIAAEMEVTTEGEGVVLYDESKFALGAEVELEAIPKYGWKLAGWSGAASGSDLKTTVVMDSLTTVTAIFVPATTEVRDTVAKFNFTYEPVLDDVEGWTGIYDHTTPPIDLPNGIHVEFDAQGHSTGSGKSGEPITPFPDKVGNTFNYLHALAEPYSFRMIISGLDTLGEYSFDAFSSRNGATSSGVRPAVYTVEGTGDSLSVNCVGNKSTIVTISNVTPDSTGTMVFSWSSVAGAYSYLNALVMTKKIAAEMEVTTEGEGVVVYDESKFALGAEVELEAIPKYGWKLAGWSGAASGSDLKTTVIMDSLTTVTAIFVPATTEVRDTVAKFNFTYEPVLDDVEGWTGIYDHTTPPIDLPNGIHVEFDAQGHSTGSGKSGEPITPFPDKVGNTFNYLHALAEPYSFRMIISGLDTLGEYSFDAFSSRNGATSSGVRPAVYTVEGTGDSLSVNCVGNKSTIVTIPNVTPDSTGTLVFSWSSVAGAYSYLNALVMTKKIPATLNVDVVGEGVIVPDGGSFALGEEVTLEAVPMYGWHFSGWSGAASGSDLTTTVIMDANTTVTATFIEMTTTLEPVAKFNFTYEPVLDDEPGWTGVYDHTTPPIDLDNGIHFEIDPGDHSIGSGKTGEAVTPFPSKVGSTYNYLHNLAVPYTVRYIIEGLDVSEKYTFEIFSSRSSTASGYRPAIYTVEGTIDTIEMDCVGNNSNLITFEHLTPDPTGMLVLDFSNSPGVWAYINALIISKELEIMADTVAKLNFTYEPVLDDEPGWTGVYDHESFPLTLGNGLSVSADTEEHSVGSGSTGEPVTIFPVKVGSTYNNLHAAFPYTVHLFFEGLDPMKNYSFEAFSSRDHMNQYTGEPYTEQRISTFGIGGTVRTADLDAIGNTDKTVKFDNVYPSADGIVEFTWSNNNNYAYLNALIVTELSYTSVADPKIADQIRYYPSPVLSYLNVEGLPSGSRIVAFDIMGRKVIDLDVNSGYSKKVDMQQLRTGVYLFRVEHNKMTIKSFKVIKK